MSKLIKLIPIVNKKNGQINTSWSKKDLPKEIIEAAKKQPSALKHFLVEIRGVDLSG
jgi:hypothetical protein